MRHRGKHHGGRRKKGSVDWVYRANDYMLDDPSLENPIFTGTYYNPIAIGAGPENAAGQVLYDSQTFTQGKVIQFERDPLEPVPERHYIDAAARPEGRKQGALIHGVEIGVYYHITATHWTTTSQVYLGLRVLCARQDPEDGRVVLDPNYSMWNNVGGTQANEPAVYANGRENCWEHRHFKVHKTIDNQIDVFIHRPFIPFKRRLEAHEGLFLYVELHANSSSFTQTGDFMAFWCRTLVSDPNG